MREITYSQDVIIKDKDLLATLSIFCEKIWLPYDRVAEDLQWAFSGLSEKDEERMARLLENDLEKEAIESWSANHSLLISEGIIQQLPVLFNPKEEKARHLDSNGKMDEEGFTSTYEGIEKRGIKASLALSHHYTRDDLPGIEFFESSQQANEIDLAKGIFLMELPKVSADDENICELRSLAQKSDIKQFWEMIEENEKYAAGEHYLKRAKKIRDDFDKWISDNASFRAQSLATAGVATASIVLSFVNSFALPVGAILSAYWLGEVNRRWVQRKTTQHRAFKFINHMHRGIRRLTR